MSDQPPRIAPQQAVGTAIQDLAAKRLGRGFVPAGLLIVVGIVDVFRGGALLTTGWILSLGGLAAVAAMLAYGLRIVQKAFGREHRAWMTLAMLGSVVPPLYSLYVLGWLGLRGLVAGGGVVGVVTAILFTGVGVWLLRSWMKVVEVERLAGVMTLNLGEKGGSA